MAAPGASRSCSAACLLHVLWILPAVASLGEGARDSWSAFLPSQRPPSSPPDAHTQLAQAPWRGV